MAIFGDRFHTFLCLKAKFLSDEGQNLLKSVEYFVSDKFENRCWKSDKVYRYSDFQYVEQIPHFLCELLIGLFLQKYYTFSLIQAEKTMELN